MFLLSAQRDKDNLILILWTNDDIFVALILEEKSFCSANIL